MANDKKGKIGLLFVEWDEAHGIPLNGLAPPPSSLSPTSKLPDKPDKDTVRTRVIITLERPVQEPAVVRFAFSVSGKATYLGCQPEPAILSCGVGGYRDGKLRTTGIGLGGGGVDNRFVQLEGLLPAGSIQFAATADFKGTDGLVFSTSGAHSKVRLPAVYSRTESGFCWPNMPDSLGESYADCRDISFTVGSAITAARASRINWNERPDTGGEINGPGQFGETAPAIPVALQTADIVAWTYTRSADSFLVPPPISGIDQSIVDRNSEKNFFSGIWLGIGGSAVVAGAQLLLQAVTRRKA
ncbi:hypothetical protein [Mycobacterium sp. SMC-11]|uniref:hypothetical protein n=1 Tax=Mycobacterium sp. SMC-11 TaxID=3385969 RepID=UPI00390C5CF4